MIQGKRPSPGPGVQRMAGLISQEIRLIIDGQQESAGCSHLIETNP